MWGHQGVSRRVGLGCIFRSKGVTNGKGVRCPILKEGTVPLYYRSYALSKGSWVRHMKVTCTGELTLQSDSPCPPPSFQVCHTHHTWNILLLSQTLCLHSKPCTKPASSRIDPTLHPNPLLLPPQNSTNPLLLSSWPLGQVWVWVLSECKCEWLNEILLSVNVSITGVCMCVFEYECVWVCVSVSYEYVCEWECVNECELIWVYECV